MKHHSIFKTPEEKSKLETIYTQYRDVMYYTAYNVLKDRETAEDVVHQVFFKILNGYLDKIELSECHKTKAFLVITTENMAIDIYRKRLRTAHVPYDEVEYLLIDNGALYSESNAELSIAINNLPIEYSSVIFLKYYYGYRSKEIAQLLGITEANVRKRISRGKKKLAKLLTEKGNEQK